MDQSSQKENKINIKNDVEQNNLNKEIKQEKLSINSKVSKLNN